MIFRIAIQISYAIFRVTNEPRYYLQFFIYSLFTCVHAALRELIVSQRMHAHQSTHMRILRRQSNEKLFLV